MVKLIRNNNAIGYLLLMIILAATKFVLYSAPVLAGKEVPFLFKISSISFDLAISEAYQKMLVILLLIIQGFLLQWVIVRHRFIEKGNAIVPFLYVFSALALPDHFYFNDGLWINFVIIYLVNIVLGAYDKEGLKDKAFLNIGSFVTLAVLILPSTWVLLPYILIALSLFVVIKDRQIWLVLLSSIMMIVLIFSIIYLTGKLDPSAWGHTILPSMPSLESMAIGPSITLMIMLVIGMIGVMASLSMLQLRANKIRNQFWSFVLLYMLAVLAVFLYPDTRYFSFQLLVIPFTAILSFVVLSSKLRWFYEGLFILAVWSLYIVSVGYLSY